jgi:MFS family permease
LRAVAGNRDLRRVEAAFALFVGAELGSWVAILVYAYLRGGATETGVAVVVQLTPAAIFAPFVGAAADRLGGARVLVAGYALQAATMTATAVALAVAAPSWLVYVAAASATTTVTTTRPTQAVVTPSLARAPVELGAVNVLSGWITAAGGLVAPAVAGLLVSRTNPATAFFVAAGANGGAALLALPIHRDRRVGATLSSATRQAARDVQSGLATIRRNASLRLMITLVGALFVLVGAVDVFAVSLAIGELGLGRGGAGYLSAAFGGGGIAGAVIAMTLIGRRTIAPYLAAAAVVAGGALVFLGSWTTVGAAFVLLGVAGAGRIVFDVSAATLLQRSAPPHVLSRVFALAEGLAMAGMAAGALLVPALIAVHGLELALVAVGLLLPLIVVSRFRAVVAIDEAATVPVVEIALLRNMRMFTLLPPPALEGLAHALIPVEVPAGTDVIREGEDGERFYAIVDGSVEVSVGGKRVASLGRGEGFGEIALLHGIPRTATVTADTDLRIYALERDAFLVALTGYASAQEAAHDLVDQRLQELHDLDAAPKGLSRKVRQGPDDRSRSAR